jgi:hypothetical protein
MPLSQCWIDSSSLLVRHDKIRCIKKFIFSVILLSFYCYFIIYFIMFCMIFDYLQSSLFCTFSIYFWFSLCFIFDTSLSRVLFEQLQNTKRKC